MPLVFRNHLNTQSYQSHTSGIYSFITVHSRHGIVRGSGNFGGGRQEVTGQGLAGVNLRSWSS